MTRLSPPPLGRETAYPEHVDAGVLHPIERCANRRAAGIGEPLPFRGEDVWTAYEFSWLAPEGMPQSAVLTLRVPCASPAMVESKSLKLYLGGFAHARCADAASVLATIERDVGQTAGTQVEAALTAPQDLPAAGDFSSFCLDGLDARIADYRVDAALLQPRGERGAEAVHTHLFRSVCPATGQPDWGSIAIAWRGRLIERASLLRYLISYRLTPGFHEDAVERIFADIRRAADADALTVHGRFLRRGGIDINPFRSTTAARAPAMRLWRQ